MQSQCFRGKKMPWKLPRKKEKRRSNYCELCEDRFFDLKTHLISEKHIKNARDPTKWEAVDALISKMTTMEKWMEDHFNNRNLCRLN